MGTCRREMAEGRAVGYGLSGMGVVAATIKVGKLKGWEMCYRAENLVWCGGIIRLERLHVPTAAECRPTAAKIELTGCPGSVGWPLNGSVSVSQLADVERVPGC